jgi:chromosome segregation ATPase
MEKKIDKKEEARTLRKKIKRVEESRSSIKDKHREKGSTIKKLKDRQTELEGSRDQWRDRCKQSEKKNADLAEKYKHLADLFEMKEEQLKDILGDVEELKKKYPKKYQ